jgi:L-alanine-DL-glutamate epimerase-like enolase superfamily enzyme
MRVQTSIRLYAADLHYPRNLQIHTAASGLVPSLSARFLEIERSDGFRGVGEVRANIEYLSKLPEAAVDPAIHDLCRRLPWFAEPEEILTAVQKMTTQVPHVASAAVENALVEGIARRDGICVADYFGGAWHAEVATNQCLFWGSEETFDQLAVRYLSEGFRQIKVRIAVGSFERDLMRLDRLRERAGPSVSIAVDANGAWSADEAINRLRSLERFNLSYVEQPTHAGDWDAFKSALKNTSIPLMLDEGLAGDSDIGRLASMGASTLAHLKIVKLGGPSAVLRATKCLRDAGVGIMIGQMNEGAMATAITAHCIMALMPNFAELYGCYGLIDDVTQGITYANGAILVPKGIGVGVMLDAARCRTVWVMKLPTDITSR